METYAGVGIFLLIAAGGLMLLYRHSKKVSLYRYRNIVYMSGLSALFVISAILVRAILLYEGEKVSVLQFADQIPEQFAWISVVYFVILCALMGISNISLMRHEGLCLKNAVGTLFHILFILGTLMILWMVRLLENSVVISHNDSWIIVFFCRMLPRYLYCLLDYCECIVAGISVMGWMAARQKPAYDKDYIIIPGCSISKGGGLLPLLKGRVNRAIRYAWEQEIATGKPVIYVPSGGQGADEIMSEGSAMEFYLLSHGAEEEEVLPEKQSATTLENFVFSKKIIENEKTGAKVAFATTNYHMLRCGLLARKAGLDVEGISSNTKWYFWPNGFVREVVALFVMTKKYHIAMAGILAVVCAGLTYFSGG